MSQNITPKFPSKIPRPSKLPRPVTQKAKQKITRDAISSEIPSHRPTNQAVKGSLRDFKTPLKRDESKSRVTFKDDIGLSELQTKTQLLSDKSLVAVDDFKPDEKALQSILSNKGITPDLSGGSRQSTMQSMKRPSLYYQPSPSRFSMIESDREFKDKMKILRERMESLNWKRPVTPQSESSTTASSTSGVKPVSIYHKMTSLQSKLNSTGDTTPKDQSLKKFRIMSLTEQKEPQTKSVKFEKPCQSSSKLDWKTKSYSSIVFGKENKLNCRFRLFSSPINEITEQVQSPNKETSCASTSSSIQTTSNSHKTHQGSENNYSYQDLLNTDNNDKSISHQEAVLVNKNISLAKTLASCPKSSELMPPSPSTVQSLSRLCNSNISTTADNSVSAPTPPVLCTSSSVKSTICTPTQETLSAPKMEEPVMPVLLYTNTLKAIDNVLGEPQGNTPARGAFKSPSVNKPPQRTPKGLGPLQLHVQAAQRGNTNTNSPFLCSYMKSRLDSRKF